MNKESSKARRRSGRKAAKKKSRSEFDLQQSPRINYEIDLDKEGRPVTDKAGLLLTNLRIDLGCGSVKKEGTLGVDIREIAGVDFVVDLEKEPFPFEDNTVEYIHSSHFLEHVDCHARIFQEITRVCKDGARLELWTPYGWSDDAFIFTHKTFFNEEHYRHICCLYPDFYESFMHARWVLHEVQYVVRPEVLQELKANSIGLDFALRYSRNVAREFGVHITVHKANRPDIPPVRRTFSVGRFAERFELRREDPRKYSYIPVEEAIQSFACSGPLPPIA